MILDSIEYIFSPVNFLREANLQYEITFKNSGLNLTCTLNCSKNDVQRVTRLN
jgi:uncharacterized membrane protein